MSDTPEPECEGLACTDCQFDRIGLSFCGTEGMYGCFMALHGQCGVTCRQVLIETCPGESCVDTDQGAQCLIFSSWCEGFSCDGCPDDQAGCVFCDGEDLVACTAMNVHEDMCPGTCACDRICHREVVGSCQER